MDVTLVVLTDDDREQFIRYMQRAFKYGALEEFGVRNPHVDAQGETISRSRVENAINRPDSDTYWIMAGGEKVGGIILNIDRVTGHNHLDKMFTIPDAQSKGIGLKAWQAVEARYPDTKTWETITPYFETRNIHFYINKCGFHAVEFFNEHHRPAQSNDADYVSDPNDLLRFVKVMEPGA
ncbi:MAG: GNAT family N-acetyltransferase [Actinomycetaceae bacterium]|nr:GNAT family N-acetyltransferase [Actinomycetaceae bacterium]